MGFASGRENPSTPMPLTEVEQDLLAVDTATTAQFKVAGIIDVRDARELALFLNIDAGGAADRLALKILVSNAEAQPAADADSWYIPTLTDGSVTPGAGSGAIATGDDHTLLPADWGVVTVRQGEIRFSAFGGATEELRPELGLKVARWRWLQVQYSDGGGGTRCAVGIKYARST